jgi:hypothetical protein
MSKNALPVTVMIRGSAIRWQSSTSQRREMACSKMSKAIKERSARNSESEVNSDRRVSLGRQGRLDYVNFGTYVPRI